MSKKAPNQASSKEDLDQLSALEESMASFGMGDLDSEHGVILKDWSAQDFANIYVRFRPHLISHARKFLREETQAEEVVQDAFLYLMTALPELDSELGVLRFLKWKTKMLCLDILRSSGEKVNFNSVPLDFDLVDASEPSDLLERADDAAVVNLAMSKLTPRQRQALFATIYEEKPHDEVAREMGISTNAFRQLLFRSRASLKAALVGETDVRGKSVSQILAISARRAYKPVTASFLGLTLLSLTAFLWTSPIGNGDDLPLEFRLLSASDPRKPVKISSNSESFRTTTPDLQSDIVSDASGSLPTGVEVETETLRDTAVAQNSSDGTSSSEADITELTVAQELRLAEALLASALDKAFVERVSASSFDLYHENGQLMASHTSGITVYFNVNPDSESIVQYLSFRYADGDQLIMGVATNSLAVVEQLGNVRFVSYAATDFLFGDFSGHFGYASTLRSDFSHSGLVLEFEMESDGSISNANLKLLPSKVSA